MVRAQIYSAFVRGEAFRCPECGDRIYTDGTSLFSHGYEIARKIGLATVLRTGADPANTEGYQHFPGYKEAVRALRATPRSQHHMNL